MPTPTATASSEFSRAGIFALAAEGFRQRGQPLLFFYVANLLGVTILGMNVVWAITGSSPTVLSAWLARLATPGIWIAVFGSYYGAGIAVSVWKKSRSLRVLIYMLVGWLIGTFLVRSAQPYIPYPDASIPFENLGDAFGAILYRLSFVAPAIVLFLIYALVEKRDQRYPLRFGDLSRKTCLFRSGGKTTSWAVWVVRIWAFVALPLFVLFQAQSGFEQILSGKLVLFLIPILLLALLNAVSEDLILQGFILPNEARVLAPGLAVFSHGLFFGLLHWGSAPDAIAGLPQGLVIGLLVWIASKAVLETGGLGYSILVHASIDVAIFSGSFI